MASSQSFFMKLVRKFFDKRLLYHPKAWRWFWTLFKYRMPFKEVTSFRDGGLEFRMGVFVDPKVNGWLFAGLRALLNLNELADAQFEQDPKTLDVLVKVHGLKFKVSQFSGANVLSEIFAYELYRIKNDGPFVVLDVGMNVGGATMYFAKSGAAHVIGYEPFAETYRQAAENVALNPEYDSIVEARHCGLSDSTRSQDISFDTNISLMTMSLFEKGPRWIDASVKDPVVKVETIQLRQASAEVDDILERFPGHDLLCKIDCEGSEYEIINELDQSGRLKKIRTIMMEWHRFEDRNPMDLVDCLGRNGFVCYSPKMMHGACGLIFAVRTN